MPDHARESALRICEAMVGHCEQAGGSWAVTSDIEGESLFARSSPMEAAPTWEPIYTNSIYNSGTSTTSASIYNIFATNTGYITYA